ncbi:MAG TPA: ABC transporter substrate-binding protein [Candidatus Limnocylindria bacterium]|nr:ABC transporter substrate-binding protein [Candidatus Limnocylindria bacterium]
MVFASSAGQSSPPASERTGGDESAATGAHRELVVGIPLLRPGTMTADQTSLAMLWPNANVYERLFEMDEQFQLKPKLAERFEFREPNTWRFYLRKGVTFHDGSPFTARDVIFTFDRFVRRGTNRVNAAEGGTVALDEHTVEMTTARPNTKVPWQLVDPFYPILKAGSDPVNHPMGTGPFKFVDFRPDESLRVERYDGYWDTPHAAKVRSIQFRVIPDGNARVLALKAGDVDLIQEVPREAVSELKRDSRLRVVVSAAGGFNAGYVNVRGRDEWALTSDRRLREAIARAVDQETIVRQIYEGNATTTKSLVPSSIFGPHRDQIKGPPPYDPALARRLLDDLGWRPGPDGVRVKDGRRLELVLGSGFPSPEVQRPMPEFLQTQLRQIGIEVQIVEMSGLSALVSGDQLRCHLWLEAYGASDPDPAGLFRFFLSPATGPVGAYGQFFGPGASVDDPIQRSLAAADFARSQELAVQGLNALVNEEVAVIPLAATTKMWAMKRSIEFTAHPATSQEQYYTVQVR